MKKRGKSFKGQVRGMSAAQAAMVRDAQRSARTEEVALRIQSAQIPQALAHEHILNNSLAAHSSLEAMRQGKAVETDFHTLAMASNLALILAELDVGSELLDDIRAGQDALMRMLARHEKHGRYLLDGQGLDAVRHLLDIFDAQLEDDRMTDKLIKRAHLTCLERMAQGQVLEVATA